MGWAKTVRIVAATHLRGPLRDDGEHVAHEVNAALLPAGPDHDFADRFDQASVTVGDHQADTVQAAFTQRAKKLGPECLCLAVADHDTEDFTAAVLGDTGRDDDGLGHDLIVDAGLDVGGVEEDVRKPGVIKGTGPERVELFVEAGADPGDLALRYAGIRAEGFHQVVDRAGRHPVNVGFHDDRVKRLVDAASAFQQAGEGAPGPQLGDREFQVSGLRGHGLLPVPVAPGGAGVGPLAPLSTDPGGGLGLDQFLEQPFGDFADEFKTIR